MKVLSGLASAWAWAWVLLGILLTFIAVGLVFVLTVAFDRRRMLAGRTFRLCGVLMATLHPYWSFGVSGPIVRPRARTVVVSNHESQADPFLVSHLPWEMKWLAKDSLFKVPCLGWSMWLAGDVPIRRGQKDSIAVAMGEMRAWLERDVPVMIFPEGTRTADGSLGEFKDGAFRLAIEAQADVLPVAVRGSREALPKHAWRFGRSRARVRCGAPISTTGKTLGDVAALKAEARAQIQALQLALASEEADEKRRAA